MPNRLQETLILRLNLIFQSRKMWRRCLRKSIPTWKSSQWRVFISFQSDFLTRVRLFRLTSCFSLILNLPNSFIILLISPRMNRNSKVLWGICWWQVSSRTYRYKTIGTLRLKMVMSRTFTSIPSILRKDLSYCIRALRERTVRNVRPSRQLKMIRWKSPRMWKKLWNSWWERMRTFRPFLLSRVWSIGCVQTSSLIVISMNTFSRTLWNMSTNRHLNLWKMYAITSIPEIRESPKERFSENSVMCWRSRSLERPQIKTVRILLSTRLTNQSK